jgi:hypothetical protein
MYFLQFSYLTIAGIKRVNREVESPPSALIYAENPHCAVPLLGIYAISLRLSCSQLACREHRNNFVACYCFGILISRSYHPATVTFLISILSIPGGPMLVPDIALVPLAQPDLIQGRRVCQFPILTPRGGPVTYWIARANFFAMLCFFLANG